MTRRQRIQAAKASMLDDAAEQVEAYDFDSHTSTAEALGVSADDCYAAAAELAQQLRAWAVRITPLTHDD